MMFRAFLGSFHEHQARKASYERTVNWFLSHISTEDPAAAADDALDPCPGFVPFVPAMPGDGNGRGAFAQNDRAFAVIGDQLVEVMASKVRVPRPLTSLPDFSLAPVITPSAPTPALAQPNPPTVQQGGTIGSTVYGYKIAATNAHGSSVASLEAIISTGYADLDANNFNHISWDAVPEATGMKVYRTTGGAAPPKLIGTLTDPSIRFFQDTGQAGTVEAPPAVDTSAGTQGTTAWAYKVVALIGIGKTAASPSGSPAVGMPATPIGYATLSAVNKHVITWVATPNAQGYEIWRTVGPGVTLARLIGTLDDGTATSFDDVGQEGEEGVPSAGNTTLTQTLLNDGSPVSISSSGDAGQQLFLVSAGSGYIFDLRTNVFAKVLDGATFGDYLEGYFIALDAGDSTFRISKPLNGFIWPDLDYQQRVSGADKWVAMAVNNKEVWLVGTLTTEVWVHTGAPEPAFPFSPIDSVFIEKGTGAPFSLIKLDTQLVWLAQDKLGGGMIVATNGYNLDPLSTQGLEQAIQKYRIVADAEGWSYQQDGRTFYLLVFPSEGRAWVYDKSTREWHERAEFPTNATDWRTYRPRAHAYAFSGLRAGVHLVVDRQSGGIYEMSLEVGTDMDGQPISRLRRAPHITNNGKEVTHDELEIVFDTGPKHVATTTLQPMMMLRWSNNGGYAWGNEHWKASGRPAQHSLRVRWTQLGSAIERVYELLVRHPAPLRLIGARLQLRAMTYG